MSGYYDPNIVKAVQESNQLDDTPDEHLVYGAPTQENKTAARAYRTQQDMNRLRQLLPGMTDYGIAQLKRRVREGSGVYPPPTRRPQVQRGGMTPKTR